MIKLGLTSIIGLFIGLSHGHGHGHGGSAPSDMSKFELVLTYNSGKTADFAVVDVGATIFNDLFYSSSTPILYRYCPNCNDEHKHIYYRRFTQLDGSFNVYGVTDNWFSENNVLNTDFKLYSTLNDALNDVNCWTYCNYNDPGVGMFRDCGVDGYVPFEWTARETYRTDGEAAAFYVYLELPQAIIEYNNGNYDGDTQTMVNIGTGGSTYDLSLSSALDAGFASIRDNDGCKGKEICFDPQTGISAAECVAIPINIDYDETPNVSFELYLKQGEIENNFGWIMSQDDGLFDRSILMHDTRFAPSGETYGLALGMGATYTGTTMISQDEYTHLVAVFEGGYPGGTGKIYINGELISETSTLNDRNQGSSSSTYDHICWNTNPGHNNHGWNGCFTGAKIFTSVLDQDDVTILYEDAMAKKESKINR
mmetsp:Transcript_12356/g.10975  ORF Transcript_12356/g.10975 Transcript_12356/m.10975 type:complete len:424 (-) Transcript_12356:385-1656(-)